MAWTIFDTFLEKQESGSTVNLDTGGDTIKIMLVDNTRAPVEATDANMTAIEANQCAGDGYTDDGATLANQDITLAAGTVKFDADDVTWSQGASGVTDAYYAVIYKFTGTGYANDIPICFSSLTGPVGNDTGDLTIQFDTDGIFEKT